MTEQSERRAGRVEELAGIVGAGAICADCVGRAYGKLGRGLTNEERGRAVAVVSSLAGTEPRQGACWVCQGLFSQAQSWADRAAEQVRGVEFSTYLFGVRLSARLEEVERYFADRFPTGAIEPLKHAFNRTVGTRFNAIFPETTVAFESPDVSFLIDVEADAIALRVGSVCLLGRYRKLVRGIPQTHWPCRRCRGRGCDGCRGTGKQYPESVEEWIAAPFVEASGASGERFHGAGREDIDARMLGDGRPFVLELLDPRRRTLDLAALREAVNRQAVGRVEISALRVVSRAVVEVVKETKASKRYRARVEFSEVVTQEKLDEALRLLEGRVKQRTPRRVAHRRADKARTRTLIAASGRVVGTTTADVDFATEGGLYVKELVSGDDGRTEPSLAGRLGVRARVAALDVLEVGWPAGEDAGVDLPFSLP